MRLSVYDVRCEYMESPLGIGPIRPRLSWRLEAGQGERHVLQAASGWMEGSSVPERTPRRSARTGLK